MKKEEGTYQPVPGRGVMDGVGERPNARDKHGWDRVSAGRDLHRSIIHITRNVLVCRDTERLYARQIMTGQAQQRTHQATADNEWPDDGPREDTLRHKVVNTESSHASIPKRTPPRKLYEELIPVSMPAPMKAGVHSQIHPCSKSSTRASVKDNRDARSRNKNKINETR